MVNIVDISRITFYCEVTADHEPAKRHVFLSQDSYVNTRAPDRGESGEDDFAHEKIKEYAVRQVRSETSYRTAERVSHDRHPKVYCVHRDIYRHNKKECHE